VIFLGLVWGSFLNAVAYRLICSKSLVERSHCPQCQTALAWYDLIPIFSWVFLQGKCRTCDCSISALYPFIELLTALIFILIFLKIPPFWWFGYGILSSAMIVTVRTDLEYFLVSRFCTLYLIPLALILSYVGLLPLFVWQSGVGAGSAFLFLYSIAFGFKKITGKDGMGQGDIDMLACIGAFIGFPGWWNALLYASLVGSVVGLLAIILGKSNQRKIPFCPFIALGTWLYLFWPQYSSYFYYYS